MTRPPRVFLGLGEVAGYYRGLREGFDAIGVESHFVDLGVHRFDYGGADPNLLADLYKALRAHKDGLAGRLGRSLGRAPRLALLAWAARRFDVFVFGFAQSFVAHYRDLALLRALGKTVILQFHGSDTRAPYMDGSVMAQDRGRTIADAIALTAAKKRAIVEMERHASAIVNIPPQGVLHARRFVDWMYVGIPARPRGVPTRDALAAPRRPGPIRVLHSPSHPEAKGTPLIRAAVERLRAQGLALELVEISGRPNAEVLAALADADVVVDQLYSDYPSPGFATEAAWFGRPVILGGYATELWRRRLTPETHPGTCYVEPDALEATLASLVVDEGRRREHGARARDFVESVWAPARVAERYLRVARADVPDAWWCEPSTFDYWEGACQPAARTRALARAMVEAGGLGALQLDDKPALRARLLGDD